MPSPRRRPLSTLTLIAVFALCVSTRHWTDLSAKDQATAAAANDVTSSSAAAIEGDEMPVKDKSKSSSAKKKVRRETPKKKKSTRDEGDTTPGTAPQESGSAGGFLPSAPGGQASGTSSDKPTTSAGSRNSETSKGGREAGNQDASPETQGPNPELVTRVMAIQDRITPDLMSQKGVVGTSTGLDEDGNVVIKVYTTGADDPKIPKSVGGVTVVEIMKGTPNPLYQAGPFDPKVRQPRPFFSGVSAGSTNAGCGPNLVTSGTVGCRLKDSKGAVYGLGCSHFFANENMGAIGDKCIQPSTFNESPLGQCPPADVFGTLFKFSTLTFVNITSTNQPLTKVDAAAVITTKAMLNNSTPAPPIAYGLPKPFPTKAFLGQKVQKFGSGTGLTKGTVTAVNLTTLVIYFNGFAKFAGQIEVTGDNVPFFAAFGDSGSLIVDLNRFPVAMVFGQVGGLIFGNPIQDVLSFLNMTIDGDVSSSSASSPPGKEARATQNSP